MIKVWIKANLYHKFFKESVDWLPLETGGILLGFKDIYNDIVVKNIIGAGPNAKHGSSSFIPDGEYQQSELSTIYSNSNRIKLT